jgi:hypothetical protein
LLRYCLVSQIEVVDSELTSILISSITDDHTLNWPQATAIFCDYALLSSDAIAFSFAPALLIGLEQPCPHEVAILFQFLIAVFRTASCC